MALLHRATSCALAALAAGSLAGCSLGGATGSEATQPLGDAVDAASSAVATARLATDLLARGRATPTVVDTALLDQIHVLDASTFALMTALPGDPSAIRLRGDAIQAVAEAATSVADARAWTNSSRDAPARTAAVATSLEASADALDEVSTAIEGS